MTCNKKFLKAIDPHTDMKGAVDIVKRDADRDVFANSIKRAAALVIDPPHRIKFYRPDVTTGGEVFLDYFSDDYPRGMYLTGAYNWGSQNVANNCPSNCRWGQSDFRFRDKANTNLIRDVAITARQTVPVPKNVNAYFVGHDEEGTGAYSDNGWFRDYSGILVFEDLDNEDADILNLAAQIK